MSSAGGLVRRQKGASKRPPQTKGATSARHHLVYKERRWKR